MFDIGSKDYSGSSGGGGSGIGGDGSGSGSSTQYIHIGADEVLLDCWSESPSVLQWMQTQGYNTTLQVLQHLQHTILHLNKVVTSRIPIVWQG